MTRVLHLTSCLAVVFAVGAFGACSSDKASPSNAQAGGTGGTPSEEIPDADTPDTSDAGGGGAEQNEPDATSNDGFEPIFNGRNLDGIASFGLEPTSLSVEDGVLKCTGKPNGYWYPPGVYRNFILRFEYRFIRPADLAPGADDSFLGNSGHFVYVTPPHKIWPQALEIQCTRTDFGGVYTLPNFVRVNDNPDQAALKAAQKPIGEWNDVEIQSNEGELKVYLNGRLLNVSPPTELKEGLIAFESEGWEIHWRNILVKRQP